MTRMLAALLLAAALALSLAAPALAEEPAPETAAPAFSDVAPDAWYRDAVLWGVEKGVTLGMPDGRFLPGSTCVRQQAAAFLHRFAGEPKPESHRTFSDLPQSPAFRDAILWCAGAGITTGAGGDRFQPKSPCTRAHIVTFLYRLAASRGDGVAVGADTDLSLFADVAQVPAFAAEPFRWAVETGLVSGTGSGKLSPNSPCTRAQILTMLYRWSWRETGYVTRPVPVYRASLEDRETARLRYYYDLPNVPYMGILDFYRRFMLGGMDLTWENGLGTLTQPDGTTAVADPAADTLEVSNLTLFTYPPSYKKGPVTSGAAIAPFLQVDTVKADRPPQPARLDLGAYGIDLRQDPDDLYLPLATLSDLFAGYENYYVAWNGAALYLTDDGLLHYPDAAMARDKGYYDPIWAKTDRPADLADFTYRELCFNLDTFYGLPGSAPLNDALGRLGLDRALEAVQGGPETKALLKSTDLTDHIAGLTKLLGYYLDDKGHTGFTALWDLLSDKDRDSQVRALIGKLIHYGCLAQNPDSEARDSSAEAILSARKAAFGTETFLIRGDTAVFSFDAFDVDYDGWETYYGDPAAPLPEDAVGNLVRALETAQADPAVTNFVLDLTGNGGGDTNALFAIESLILGKAEETMEDLLTGQIVTETYRADRNFDRVFDERDDQVRYDLRFAVLTSTWSFSCGNILPSDCRDAGIPILGEQSGGGTCPIQENVTAEGLPYRLSTFLRLRNDAGETIDQGVPVDADLLVWKDVTLPDGSPGKAKDYSGFYDVEALSRIIDAYYSETEASQPAA